MVNKLSEKGFINFVAILGHAIIDAVLFLAYAIELFNGTRTPLYFAVFSFLCIAPIIVEIAIYRKNRENTKILHIIGDTFGVLYLFAVFTAHSPLAFTYAFPMYMVIILYMDVRFCTMVGLFAFIGNLVYILIQAFSVGFTQSQIADVKIQIASLLLTAVYMGIATTAVKKVNGAKLDEIQQQKNAAHTLTENILNTSGEMITDIRQISEKMVQLGESMEHIHGSMDEVSTGSSETAESVQLQMLKTEAIQQHIIQVKNTTADIEANMEATAEKVAIGRQHMEALSEQVEKSTAANRQVQEQMKALSEYTGQMNTIIETITSIANSTGMLALNASIESARAGEAGRGFAVVAGQISNLASQTKSATVNITELIAHINQELLSVEDAVNVVTSSNKANAESTRIVSENFAGIMQGTENVEAQTKELMSIVNDLDVANADIVEHIQTISAITEEVSAHANETFNACVENKLLVDAVTGVVSGLSENAQKLQAADMKPAH